jgi:hypothetical protein
VNFEEPQDSVLVDLLIFTNELSKESEVVITEQSETKKKLQKKKVKISLVEGGQVICLDGIENATHNTGCY